MVMGLMGLMGEVIVRKASNLQLFHVANVRVYSFRDFAKIASYLNPVVALIAGNRRKI